MKIVVVGDTGLLGQAFVKTALRSGHRICGFSTSQVSVPSTQDARYTHHVLDVRSQWHELEDLIGSFRPDLVLNAAAYASIPFCEEHPVEANYLNAEVPAKLALTARAGDAYFIHISSDQVFDGKAREPYAENDPAHPLNAYGRMKRESELAVLRKNSEALVVRTNIVGIKNRGERTFAEWLIHSFRSRTPITLYTNYITSSMHVDLLSEVLLRCSEKRVKSLFHIVSSDHMSKYEFGQRLAGKLGLDFSSVAKEAMVPDSMMPRRPEFLALNTSRIEKELSLPMPPIGKTLDLLAAQTLAPVGGASR